MSVLNFMSVGGLCGYRGDGPDEPRPVFRRGCSYCHKPILPHDSDGGTWAENFCSVECALKWEQKQP